jgi:hypothetical protein
MLLAVTGNKTGKTERTAGGTTVDGEGLAFGAKVQAVSSVVNRSILRAGKSAPVNGVACSAALPFDRPSGFSQARCSRLAAAAGGNTTLAGSLTVDTRAAPSADVRQCKGISGRARTATASASW